MVAGPARPRVILGLALLTSALLASGLLVSGPALADDPKVDSREDLKAFKAWWAPRQRDLRRARTDLERVAIVEQLAEREEVVAGTLLVGFTTERNRKPVRLAAARALASARYKQHVPRMVEALDDARDLEVEVELTYALGEIGDPRAIEELCKLLRRQDFVLVRQVLRAVRKINAPGSVRRLIKFALQVYEPEQYTGARAGTKNKFDWKRQDEVQWELARTLEVLTGQRFAKHEQWRDWLNENEDQFREAEKALERLR